jgi:hypothetical protein
MIVPVMEVGGVRMILADWFMEMRVGMRSGRNGHPLRMRMRMMEVIMGMKMLMLDAGMPMCMFVVFADQEQGT